jgi:hypothetical protein
MEYGIPMMKISNYSLSYGSLFTVKFYNPRKDGSEPFIDYDQVFAILQSVHYPGFLDIVYEPGVGTTGPGEDARTATPRIVKFLRSKAS